MTFAAISLVSCTTDRSEAATGAASAASGGDLPEVLATIGDEKVTVADVRARAGEELDQVETQYLRARSRIVQGALDNIVRERIWNAEAKKQGKTVEEIVKAEAGTLTEPTDAEIAGWYASNPSRTGGRPLEQIRAQIAGYLREERLSETSQKLEKQFYEARGVKFNFEPYRLTFNNAGAPAIGKPQAPVTLIEFSDFQCPFCNRFVPTLKEVERTFGDKVQIVYRQYPIPSIHPNAFKASEASLCAHEQGKFWEMHDLMFQEQAKLAVADLKEKAGRLGLDQKKFNQCLDTGKFVEQVQTDMAEAKRVGVTGTPAVFINGSQLQGGAVPFQTVAEAIQRELDRLPSSD